MPETWTVQRLLEESGSFLISRILISAGELDLFTKLETKPRTVAELCEAEGWDPRGLRILMDALVANGLLSRSEDGLYGVPEALSGLLTGDGQHSVLPMILHRGQMWGSWSHLTDIVRTGENPHRMDMSFRSNKDTESFIGAMHVIGRMSADRIVQSVDLSGFKRLLDVGGGAGTYTMAFLRKAPHLKATLFDLPEVIEIARAQLTKDGFIDRVELVPGDYGVDELPGGFDLALLSAVIHSNGREENRALFRNVFRSLESGGTVLVRDYFLDETRTYPPDGAMFAVNMLVATAAGTAYTFAETRENLESAGFREVKLIREGTRMDQLVAAVK
jgi:predicted O-methyltransferase YrrM